MTYRDWILFLSGIHFGAFAIVVIVIFISIAEDK